MIALVLLGLLCLLGGLVGYVNAGSLQFIFTVFRLPGLDRLLLVGETRFQQLILKSVTHFLIPFPHSRAGYPPALFSCFADDAPP